MCVCVCVVLRNKNFGNANIRNSLYANVCIVASGATQLFSDQNLNNIIKRFAGETEQKLFASLHPQ